MVVFFQIQQEHNKDQQEHKTDQHQQEHNTNKSFKPPHINEEISRSNQEAVVDVLSRPYYQDLTTKMWCRRRSNHEATVNG